MTNADKIRSMTDEELAEVFSDADWCQYCGQMKENGICRAMEKATDEPLYPYCVAGCLSWLKQPYKEDKP